MQSTTRRTAPIFAQVRLVFGSTGYVERTIPFNEPDDEQLTSGFAVSVFADSDFVPSHVPTAAILLPQKQGKTRFFAFYVLE